MDGGTAGGGGGGGTGGVVAGVEVEVLLRKLVPVVAAKLACAAVVFAVWTYPAQRRLVFARGAEVA